MLVKLGGCNSTILVVVIKLIVAFCFCCWVLSCLLFAVKYWESWYFWCNFVFVFLLVSMTVKITHFCIAHRLCYYSICCRTTIICGTWETCMLFFSQYLVAIGKVICILLVDLRYRWNPANKYGCLMSIMITKSCYLH